MFSYGKIDLLFLILSRYEINQHKKGWHESSKYHCVVINISKQRITTHISFILNIAMSYRGIEEGCVLGS